MHIRHAKREDFSSIATVHSNAMLDDEVSLWLSPSQRQYQHIHRERCWRMTRRRWNAGMFMLVAVTDQEDQDWNGTEMVVGYASYEKEIGATDDSKARANTWPGAFERFLYRMEDNYNWYFRHNLNTDKSRFLKVYEILSGRNLLNAYDRFWELDMLVVLPGYGRRGIGGKLVDWGQDRAREDGVPLLLWASVMGTPLYARKGFKEIDRIVFDENVDAPVMMWLPEGVADPRLL